MPYAGYSSRIPELLLQQGQQQANKQLQRGQNLASLIQGIGNSAAALPAQIMAGRAEDKAKKEVELAHTLAAQFRRPDGTTDFEKVLGGLRQAGAHQAADEVEKNLVAQRASDAARKTADLTARNTESEIAARNAESQRKGIQFQVEQREKADTSGRLLAVRTILNGHANPESGKVEDWPTAIDAVRKVDPEAADHLLKNWQDSQKSGADLTDRARRDAAARLSMFTTPEDYAKRLAALSPELQSLFPETPTNRRDLLKVGMSPKEIVDADLEQARINKPPASSVTSGSPGDAQSIADAIMAGEQPPELTGLYRLAGPVKAALARAHYNQVEALTDWRAVQKHVATLNGSKVTQLRSSIQTAAESLDVIDDLASQWKGGGFPILNKANLALAKSGTLGKKAAEIANQLEGQITDVVSELGQVYMGGNSPTDHALKLAEKNLRADWDEAVLKSMTKLARTNLRIRNNSVMNSGAAGGSDDNPYDSTKKTDTVKAPRKYYDANGNEIIK